MIYCIKWKGSFFSDEIYQKHIDLSKIVAINKPIIDGGYANYVSMRIEAQLIDKPIEVFMIIPVSSPEKTENLMKQFHNEVYLPLLRAWYKYKGDNTLEDF